MERVDKIVLITKKTPLEELIERFGSAEQARFYLTHGGGSYDDFADFHARYESALDLIRASIPEGIRFQEVDRKFLPNFVFGPHDLVATLGPDGLVVNTAKYLDHQPIIPFNPDPSRIDGVLATFSTYHVEAVWKAVLAQRLNLTQVVMAQATLNNGQTLFGVNDLFIGQRTHVSARYEIAFEGRRERHSSSGIIVSTGAGSTGWYRSVVTGAEEISASVWNEPQREPDYAWSMSSPELRFSVREPFGSKITQTSLCAGRIVEGEELLLVSEMPQNGVIFSDGIEEDFLPFNSGSSARIGIAERRVSLAYK
ncbi:MAG: hypothetical protein KF784_15475 [Fimbriimonadaceae bacterium]|nr:hypothetical protein [Fimbriimonadaceae bacterium]